MKYESRQARRWGPLAFAGVILLAAVAGAGAYLGSPAGARRLARLRQRVEALPSVPALSAAPSPPPLAPTALFEGTQDVPVLMYHDVTEDSTVYFDVSPAEFRRQMKELKSAGAHVIPLADLYEHLRSGKQIPPRAVVLTFDDGYLGTYQNGYPVLKEFGYPATFFVHTGVVGVRTSREHMSWDQLQSVDREGVASIECHTITHPDDLRKLSDTQLNHELVDSKKLLEEKLGRKIRFLAYPVGNADGRVARVARDAGYEMCFTMGPGWARSAADAFFVPRFMPKYLPEVVARLKSDDLTSPVQPQVVDLKPAPIESGAEEDGQVRMKWIRGGRLCGVRLSGRRDVPAIVRAAGAAAGLNGTFFSDARVNSAGAGIVGPIASRLGPGFAPGLPGDRERIAGRPLILISPEKIAFVPFQPHLALDEDGIQRLLPGATDCFISGAWLVHRGHPLTHEEMDSFRLSNIFDFRPRAFFGVDKEGHAFLGASSTGNQSDRLAVTLAKLGLQECVLLDSGFSTSLVLGDEVLVRGIRRTDMPARPVPHALVLYPVDPQTGKEIVKLDPASPGLWSMGQNPSLEGLQAQFSSGEPIAEQELSPAAARGSTGHTRRHLRRHRWRHH